MITLMAMGKIFLMFIIKMCWTSRCAGQQQSIALPVGKSPTIYDSTGSSGSTCPSQDTINEELTSARETIMNYYNRSLPCSCGGPEWMSVAYLNMFDPNQQCPSNWTLTTTPVRGCGRSSPEDLTCDSVVYPVNVRNYSSVCGRVNAYQFGRGTAFYSQINTVESSYVTGVSITHGLPGSRKHIWTFAAALSEGCTTSIRFHCPCSNININWPYEVPYVIGSDYFCESGRHSTDGSCSLDFSYYPDDLLWDGQNCAPGSTCCELNNPSWFVSLYLSLPVMTWR